MLRLYKGFIPFLAYKVLFQGHFLKKLQTIIPYLKTILDIVEVIF